MVKKNTNEILELKKRSSKTSTSNKPSKSFPFQRNNNNSNNNNQPAKSTESSNFALNIDNINMENYYYFHQEYHSEKTCP